MIDTLYIEREVAEHPRTLAIRGRFPKAEVVVCERYGEVFNRKGQSFRLQKRRPAVVLARKVGRSVYPTPAGYGIGAARNVYFSHMLNCIYDCRYCFLQGMYGSAHHVVFVSFEEMMAEMEEVLAEAPGVETHFFSGYDCDSLAFEPVTGFAAAFLPWFEERPEAVLELRTKSVQLGPFAEREPLPNVVVAWSFTPEEVSRALEHKVPSVERRLEAMESLGRRGWKLGLRFDPVIYHPDFRAQYRRLFDSAFRLIEPENLHSVSLGPFRLPDPFFRKVVREHPDERLFAGPLESRGGMVSYGAYLEAEMLGFLREEILARVPAERFYPFEIAA